MRFVDWLNRGWAILLGVIFIAIVLATVAHAHTGMMSSGIGGYGKMFTGIGGPDGGHGITVPADHGDSLRYQGGYDELTKEEIADLVWADSDDSTLWLSENVFIYDGDGWADTVTILWNTKSYVNDSALLAHGYMKVDGGWMAYFGNPDRPRIIKRPVIHFLQDSQLAGDANGDGLVNVGDVVWLLRFIFS